MLDTLIESRAQRHRNPLAQLASIAFHATAITAAIVATQRAALEKPAPLGTTIRYVPIAPAPRVPPSVVPAGVRTVRVLIAPIAIPSVLPEIDLSVPATNPDDFISRPGLTSVGTPVVGDGRVRTDREVEKVASLVPGTATPVYPELLRSAGVAGEVELQFVIDTTGRVEPASIVVLSSTHAKFSEAAMRALARARFVPAEFGGAKVRQLVRMPFVFSVRKD